MKILLLSDLHGEARWYEWLLEAAKRYDCVALAGDLIDMFQAPQPQLEFLRDRWFPRFTAAAVPLAFCTGNHDFGLAEWLPELVGSDRVVADGVTRLVRTDAGEALLLTTVPYIWNFSTVGSHGLVALWERGAELRLATGAPWLVLHHEPPAGLAPAPVSNQLESWLARYTPDYVSSGHFHGGPNRRRRFAQRVAASLCFNGGQTKDAPWPNHIVLDLGDGTATWRRAVVGPASWTEQSRTIALSGDWAVEL